MGEDEAVSAEMRRFAAFISYSHADAELAAKLQRQLERYRLPRHVELDPAAQGNRLGRIFRDREDLAAASSLSDAIRAALADSASLIVICSPDAKQSRWVNDEITLFQSLHPERPILVALVSGEPAEAFPDALTAGGREPLAADLRKNADGWSLGFLKIVAGIAGVPLDALVQRDAQRRIRRVTGITLAALAAMLVMGVMTAFALSARNEAARQRASAEGLVEYMLTDLRDKLRGVGRIDVMDGVNQRAMEHYRGQSDLGSLPAGSLEQRARILLAMGEDDDKSGKPEQARAKFLEAHRATAALLYREPDNPDRIFAHAQSEYWVGQAAWRKRDRQATSKYWHGYARQAARLLEVDPDKARANLEMGYASGNLCDLYYYQNYDLKKAVDYCRQAIRFEKAALERAPGKTEIAMALANSYGWLAEVLVADKAFADARKAREEEQQIVDRLLARDPKNFELRFRRLWPEFGSAAIDIAAGQEQDGVRKLEALDRQFAALSREAPDNVEVKRAMARSLYAQTGALMTQDPAAARVKLQQLRGAIAAIGRTPGQIETLTAFLKEADLFEAKLNRERSER